jgi:hypothetical protein
MGQFGGQPVTFNRFLGAMDQDDPTNVPSGLSPVCRNTDFDLTSAGTRCGFNLTMTGVNKSPITGMLGFLYQPELATESAFQMPLLFDFAGAFQQETPVGSGTCKQFEPGIFVPPANSHASLVQAGNRVYGAFSDLTTPTSGLMTFDPTLATIDPFGMKPYGWLWQPNTACIVGEMMCPPSVGGNGHTYRCITAGTTGPGQPAYPLTEGGKFTDGTVTWQELTMVIANRLPAPAAPVLNLNAGTFATGLDVYVVLAYNNGQGETIVSPSSVITTNYNAEGVQVTLPTLASLAGWIKGLPTPYIPTSLTIYETSVAHGQPAPPQAIYQAVATVAFGSSYIITAAGTGATPPQQNTARVTGGMLPTPDTEAVLARTSAMGTFAAGRDIWVRLAYANANGETPVGPSNSIVDTQALDAVSVTLVAVALYPQLATILVYEADVATGTSEPPSTAYALVGSYAPGATVVITNTASGPIPTTVNTTGGAGNIVADTPNGGTNATQGMRYAAAMFMNRSETVSGFTQQSVVSTIIDEDGWEIACFNVAIGPGNVVARMVAFTVADGTSAGPFDWIGLVNLKVPSQDFVYPATFVSDNIPMTATCFLDNLTSSGIFNFTDEYLILSNDVTDRLRIAAPFQAVRVDYLKSVDRIALTGVKGYLSGAVISLGADYESFYGSTSPLPVATNQRSWGFVEYRNVIYLMRERGADIVTPNTGDPSTWDVKERWDGVGACGPRAFDACGKFIIFAHQSGIYRYVDTDTDLMTKEIPKEWHRINWKYGNMICCTIDQDTHTVRFLVPLDNSVVPNEEIVLSYIEGWENPIHYSVYAGAVKAMDACRRYSFNDMAAFVCLRMQRAVPNPVPVQEGTANGPQTDATFYISQLLYGSSAADGAVQARQPGTISDNGSGIDWQYETSSVGMMMGTVKIEGFVLNATGTGQIDASFLAARDMVTGQDDNGTTIRSKELKVRPIFLTVNQNLGISRMLPAKVNEFWRVRFTNGKRPDSSCSLKFMKVFVIPLSGSRGELDT